MKGSQPVCQEEVNRAAVKTATSSRSVVPSVVASSHDSFDKEFRALGAAGHMGMAQLERDITNSFAHILLGIPIWLPLLRIPLYHDKVPLSLSN